VLGFTQHSTKGRGGVLIPGGCWLPAKVPTKNWRRSLRGSRGGGGGGRLVPPRECAPAKGGWEKEKASGECTLKICGLEAGEYVGPRIKSDSPITFG